MKNVMGGKNAPIGDDGITCKTACVKADSQGNVTSGTCSKSSVVVGGVTLEGCDCSVSGGSGCY